VAHVRVGLIFISGVSGRMTEQLLVWDEGSGRPRSKPEGGIPTFSLAIIFVGFANSDI
jgi:hypothetical protein